MNRPDQFKNLTVAQRGAIVGLSAAGLSHSAIARQLGCSRATVIRWIERHAETQDVKRKAGSGRPKVLTNLEEGRILRFVRDHPITTAKEIIGNRFQTS